MIRSSNNQLAPPFWWRAKGMVTFLAFEFSNVPSLPVPVDECLSAVYAKKSEILRGGVALLARPPPARAPASFVAQMVSRKECTLLLLRGDDPATGADSLLLGLKKRGFGAGKLNGFGGKLDPGETLLEGALREMAEESGVAVPPSSARHVGHLTFIFSGREAEELHVHVFAATAPFSGAPVETEEMAPRWAPVAALPFGQMWPDDAHWMPLLLRGARFRGTFYFAGHAVIERFELEEVGAEEASPCAHAPDAAAAVLVPAGQPPQTAVDF